MANERASRRWRSEGLTSTDAASVQRLLRLALSQDHRENSLDAFPSGHSHLCAARSSRGQNEVENHSATGPDGGMRPIPRHSAASKPAPWSRQDQSARNVGPAIRARCLRLETSQMNHCEQGVACVDMTCQAHVKLDILAVRPCQS